MIQLSFQPAFDPLNCVFRLLRMLPILEKPDHPLEIDHVRILDFYLLYPYRLEAAKLKREHRALRAVSKRLSSLMPYGSQPDDLALLERMRPMQTVAIRTVAAHGFLDGAELSRGRVFPVGDAIRKIPSDVMQRINAANEREPGNLGLVSTLASDYDLRGPDGLKARTGLMEYRYDPI